MRSKEKRPRSTRSVQWANSRGSLWDLKRGGCGREEEGWSKKGSLRSVWRRCCFQSCSGSEETVVTVAVSSPILAPTPPTVGFFLPLLKVNSTAPHTLFNLHLDCPAHPFHLCQLSTFILSSGCGIRREELSIPAARPAGAVKCHSLHRTPCRVSLSSMRHIRRSIESPQLPSAYARYTSEANTFYHSP